MTASEIAHSIMARPRKNGQGWLVLCPVHGDRHPSLRIRNGEGGKLLVHCFSGCVARDVLKTLVEMGLLDGSPTTGPIPPPEPEPKDDTERRIDKAERMWDEAAPIREGDPVWFYLKNRGITLETWPEDLRCHPGLPYWEVGDSGKPIKTGTFPAMIAVIRSPEGKPVALHRTYLTEDGKKAPVEAPKKIFPVGDLSGSAVRLFPPRDGVLGVTEGIETALSVFLLYGESCWSSISAYGMAGFIPPEDVSTVRIFADRDPNRAGLKAALALATTLRQKEKAVRIFLPDHRYGLKADFNDILTRSANREVKRNLTHATV